MPIVYLVILPCGVEEVNLLTTQVSFSHVVHAAAVNDGHIGSGFCFVSKRWSSVSNSRKFPSITQFRSKLKDVRSIEEDGDDDDGHHEDRRRCRVGRVESGG